MCKLNINIMYAIYLFSYIFAHKIIYLSFGGSKNYLNNYFIVSI